MSRDYLPLLLRDTEADWLYVPYAPTDMLTPLDQPLDKLEDLTPSEMYVRL